MKNLTIFLLSALLVIPALAQDEDGKEKKEKKKGLNLREELATLPAIYLPPKLISLRE